MKTTATLTSEEGSAIEGVGTGKYSISYHSLPCSFENESKSVTERDIHMTKLLASLFGRNAVIDLTTLLENDQVNIYLGVSVV